MKSCAYFAKSPIFFYIFGGDKPLLNGFVHRKDQILDHVVFMGTLSQNLKIFSFFEGSTVVKKIRCVSDVLFPATNLKGSDFMIPFDIVYCISLLFNILQYEIFQNTIALKYLLTCLGPILVRIS